MSEQKYIALIVGKGYGCDYTIGCNLNWDIFNVDDPCKINLEIKKIYEYYGGECIIKSIEVFAIEKFGIKFNSDDLQGLFKEDKEKEAEEKRKEDEEEFKRLKKKLGKG